MPSARAYRKNGAWGELPAGELTEYETYGPTCDAGDKMAMHLPADLQAGDVLHIPSAGAYTAPTCATGFNGFEAPKWHYRNGKSAQMSEESAKVMQFLRLCWRCHAVERGGHLCLVFL